MKERNMSKDAFYFPHDSNAKDDPKCVLLIEQLGLEGYGIYWVLIETLRDQPGYTYPLVLIPALARRFNTTTEKIKAVITGYKLFAVDEYSFYSESLIRRMEPIDHRRELARIAGKASAEKRLLNIGSTTVQQPLDFGSASVQPKREENSKVYKSKEEKITSATPEDVNILNLYESNIGALTPIIIEKIKSSLTEYSNELITMAIRKAVSSEKRSWGYVEGILKGWKRDGFNNGNGHKNIETPKSKYKYVN
jgi:DnaD/phage-associated family protein